ncbi:alpha-N-acetylneuraminide alpha-2,8-sialyltransferase-like isoform X3 [Anneissia japonica]|uniref:alpha-N-acetylneuraminide alpha-2,8-sialyltransferase-like isoform X3 n=1 Tax=Anneissia japonica TaxID=1529436 RepID=UPI001425B35C|nr:alpha-N-acetylneuraminide alpha-2,8-sialyltransferase-like isoform X3 [Anneissia japonica]
MKSRHLLMCLIFALTLSVWWQFYQLTFSRSRPKFVNVMEESGSFLHQIKSIPKLTNFTRDNYSSGIEQDREYYVNESIIGISSKVQNIHEIAALLQKPWKLNTTKVSLLREDIARSIRSEMILTKKYIRPFQKITYSLRKQTATISKKFHNTLPEVSPIQRLHKRCSIVGNGGILSKSKCGNAIDRADFVIRCNAPPINEFREDAGVKSNITTFNPSIIISRFGRLLKRNDQNSFIKSINQYKNYIWFPSLSHPYPFFICLKASELIHRQSRIKVLNGNPDHFRQMSRYWKSNSNVNKTLSSGFYMILSALTFCEEIHLYGFWPFYTDLHNRSLSYHYYENLKLKIHAHDFDNEFKELLWLHSEGILQLHVDKC